MLIHLNCFRISRLVFLAVYRSAENGKKVRGHDIKFDEKIITVGADVAKKRSQRHVDMKDALGLAGTVQGSFGSRAEPVVDRVRVHARIKNFYLKRVMKLPYGPPTV